MTLLVGDCLKTLKTLKDNSVDSVVTDPPYEIGFMGKSWDGSGIAYNVELWRECLRVLKPGGHVLAFGATRSYHRMAVAIEDAGFEIRDSIHWSYGSGFPKSLNVGKAIDQQKANRDEKEAFAEWLRANLPINPDWNYIDETVGSVGCKQKFFTKSTQYFETRVPTLEQIPKLLDVLGVDVMPEDIQALALRIIQPKGKPGPNWFKREVVGTKTVNGEEGTAGGYANGIASHNFNVGVKREVDVTAPATENSAKWEGWGTALKPSHEPVVVARKPLTSTVAANVLEYGTGALNIDGSRIGTDGGCADGGPSGDSKSVTVSGNGLNGRAITTVQGMGRWPANTVLTMRRTVCR